MLIMELFALVSPLALWALLFIPMFFFPGCPCCDTEGFGCGLCTDELGGLGAMPSDTWRFTLEGLSNGTESDCTVYNGTFDITMGTTPQFSPIDDCLSSNENCEGGQLDIESTGNSLSLAFNTDPFQFADGEVGLAFGDGVAGWSESYCRTDWEDCGETSHELTLFGTPGGECSGWPATITISAV